MRFCVLSSVFVILLSGCSSYPAGYTYHPETYKAPGPTSESAVIVSSTKFEPVEDTLVYSEDIYYEPISDADPVSILGEEAPQ